MGTFTQEIRISFYIPMYVYKQIYMYIYIFSKSIIVLVAVGAAAVKLLTCLSILNLGHAKHADKYEMSL